MGIVRLLSIMIPSTGAGGACALAGAAIMDTQSSASKLLASRYFPALSAVFAVSPAVLPQFLIVVLFMSPPLNSADFTAFDVFIFRSL
jgi:hypothetical protein